MNKAPLVFLGVLFTLSLSWWGMVYSPAIQLGGETPDKGDGTALKPRVGLARQGEQVYRENGCYYCHTRTATGGQFGYKLQITRLDLNGTITDSAIGGADKMLPVIKQAYRFKAVAKAADALKTELGKTEGKSDAAIKAAKEAKVTAVKEVKSAELNLEKNLKALGISGVSLDKDLSLECGLPAEKNATQKKLVANAQVTITSGIKQWSDIEAKVKKLKATKARFRLQPVASDWPDRQNLVAMRQSVSRDFLFDAHAMPGVMRIGPDLSNVGGRLIGADNDAYAHIYNPQSTGKSSHMPPYRYLFHRKKITEDEALPTTAITVTIKGDKRSVEPGYAVTPTAKARALLAFLKSLRTDSALPEAPIVEQAAATSAGTREK
tara:strand:+ start:479 stop:1615 length:1137 start_codon:yes stop_codon:yes gene_type:complete